MKTYKYKTLKGLLTQCNMMRVKSLFSGRAYFNKRKNNKLSNFDLSNDAKLMAATLVAEYIYSSRIARKKAINGLLSGAGDLSFFHCFYIEYENGKIRCSHSLSGAEFNYCKRMYLKSL